MKIYLRHRDKYSIEHEHIVFKRDFFDDLNKVGDENVGLFLILISIIGYRQGTTLAEIVSKIKEMPEKIISGIKSLAKHGLVDVDDYD